MIDERITPGSVVQINERHGGDEPEERAGWVGAFVLVTEVRSWGVQGFVQIIDTHDAHGRAFIRLPWEEIEYIGQAVLVPAESELK